MKRRLSSGAIQRSSLRHLIALCVVSLTLVPSGCGGGEEPVGPSVEEPTPVAPPPPEPEPEPEPEPRPDISAVRSIADESSVQSDQVFLVQVGAFSNPMNSERLTSRLRELSFEVQTNTEGGLRIVRVGPFQDRRTAEEAAHAIEEATSLSPLVMRN